MYRKVRTLDWTSGMDYWTGIFWFLFFTFFDTGWFYCMETNDLLGTFSSRKVFFSNLNVNVDKC